MESIEPTILLSKDKALSFIKSSEFSTMVSLLEEVGKNLNKVNKYSECLKSLLWLRDLATDNYTRIVNHIYGAKTSINCSTFLKKFASILNNGGIAGGYVYGLENCYEKLTDQSSKRHNDLINQLIDNIGNQKQINILLFQEADSDFKEFIKEGTTIIRENEDLVIMIQNLGDKSLDIQKLTSPMTGIQIVVVNGIIVMNLHLKSIGSFKDIIANDFYKAEIKTIQTIREKYDNFIIGGDINLPEPKQAVDRIGFFSCQDEVLQYDAMYTLLSWAINKKGDLSSLMVFGTKPDVQRINNAYYNPQVFEKKNSIRKDATDILETSISGPGFCRQFPGRHEYNFIPNQDYLSDHASLYGIIGEYGISSLNLLSCKSVDSSTLCSAQVFESAIGNLCNHVTAI